jgi:hypothetical protein
MWPAILGAILLSTDFRFIEEDDRADFFIAFTEDDCDRSLPGRPVYQVERMGALLSVVLDRRDTGRPT